MTDSITKTKLSFRVKTLVGLTAVLCAVALPQILHVLGALSGLSSTLGEVFLPMHLPVILAGMCAGTYAGAASGFIAPLISFALTGMPSAALLPFMMLELCAYGAIAGALSKRKMPVILKLLIVQLGGRAVRAIAILTAFYAFGYTAVPLSIIITSVSTGLIGLALQWAFVPLIMYRVDNNER